MYFWKYLIPSDLNPSQTSIKSFMSNLCLSISFCKFGYNSLPGSASEGLLSFLSLLDAPPISPVPLYFSINVSRISLYISNLAFTNSLYSPQL